jgi:hypothetical protein
MNVVNHWAGLLRTLKTVILVGACVVISLGQGTIIFSNLPVVSIQATKPQTSEPRDSLLAPGEFTVFREDQRLDLPLSVLMSYSGTASAEDHLPLPLMVIFTAGASAVKVPVYPQDDQLVEGSEVVTAKIIERAFATEPTSRDRPYRIAPSNGVASVTIQDAERDQWPSTIELLSPIDGSAYNAGAPVGLWARAIDPDAYFTRLEFYAGTNRIAVAEGGEPGTPGFPSRAGTPFYFRGVWTNPPSGPHLITAVAIDSEGVRVTSNTQFIKVGPFDERPSIGLELINNLTSELNGQSMPGGFRVRRLSGSTDEVVLFSFQISGLARNDLDFEGISSQGTIPRGAMGAEILVRALPDNETEGLETATFTLNEAGCGEFYPGCYTIVGDRSVDIHIQDGPQQTNRAPFVTIHEPVAGQVYEPGQWIVIRAEGFDVDGRVVRMDADIDGRSITYKNQRFLLARTNAAPGLHTIRVYARDNAGAVSPGAAVSIVVRTNETLPLVSITAPVSLTIEGAAQNGGSLGRFQLTRTGTTGEELRVRLQYGGSATPGADYRGTLRGLAYFAPGAAETSIEVPAADDRIPEPAETVVARIVPEPYPFLNGLRAWWTADGHANDLTPSTNHGTAFNVTYADGKKAEAFTFNGTNSLISVPRLSTLSITSFTFTAWINPQDLSYGPILEYGASNEPVGVHLWAGGGYGVPLPGSLLLNVRDRFGKNHSLLVPDVIPSNQWSFVSGTFDYASGLAKLYLNGNEIDSQNFGSIVPRTDRPLTIGRRDPSSLDAGAGAHFKGRMDEIQVYNRSLSAPEIAEIYSYGAGSYSGAQNYVVDPIDHTATVVITDREPIVSIRALVNETEEGTPQSSDALGRFQLTRTGSTAEELSVRLQYGGSAIQGTDYWIKTVRNLAYFAPGAAETSVEVWAREDSIPEPAETVVARIVAEPYPLLNGLRAWWTGDGGANDLSSGTNHATPFNITYSEGKKAEAFAFNGANSYMTVPTLVPAKPGHHLSLTNFTFTAWINPQDLSYGPILEYGASREPAGVHLWIGAGYGVPLPGSLLLNVRDWFGNNHSLLVSDVIPSNQWSFVAGTFDGTNGLAKLYLNGNEIDSQNFGSIIPRTDRPLTIGRRDPSSLDAGAGAHFKGRMDEIQVYNRALSAAEIAEIYSYGAGTYSGAQNYVVDPTNHTATVVITDKEPADRVLLALEILNAVASEPSMHGEVDTGMFRIRQVAGPTNLPVSVWVRFSGTAAQGRDYAAMMSHLSFPTNQRFIDIPISPLADNLIEGDETVVLTLNPGNCDPTNSVTWPSEPSVWISCYGIVGTNVGQVVIRDGPGGSNLPPSVAITSPIDGAVFTRGQRVEVRAHAEDIDGSIANIQLRMNARTVYFTNGPALLFWTNPPAGEHTLVAVTTDNRGSTRESVPIRFLVRETNQVSFARRELPAGYIPGIPFVVRIQVNVPDSTQAWGLEDAPPLGWTVTAVSDGGIFDTNSGKVKFGHFLGGRVGTLSYTVRPPLGALGTVEFNGAVSLDGRDYSIGGQRTIAPAASEYHPADLNRDRRIVLSEVTGYAAAWKRGTNWINRPNPIPASYVTYAAYLWRQGETYNFNPTNPPPKCWVPTTGGGRMLAASASTAIRTIQNGEDFAHITLQVQPGAGVGAYTIEERVPNSFSVLNLSSDGLFDEANRVIRWGVYMDGEPRSLSYSLLPTETAGSAQVSGEVSLDGESMTFSGDTSVLVNGATELSLPATAIAADGSVKFQLSGPSGQVCDLESSTDLVNWKFVTELFLPDGKLEYTDYNPHETSQQYYRLKAR